MPAKRVWPRRVAVLFAMAIATATAVVWLVIRADLQTARAALRSSSARDVPISVLNAFTVAEDPCHWRHSRAHTLATLIRMFSAHNDEMPPELAGHASLAHQLVRQHVSGRGVSRQLRELAITAVVEATEDPSTVAKAYAKQVYLGTIGRNHIYGVTDAARAHYGKRPSQLNVEECVALAAAIKSPRIYSCDVQSGRAVVRRFSVLGRMRELGLVSQQDFVCAERKLRSTAG